MYDSGKAVRDLRPVVQSHGICINFLFKLNPRQQNPQAQALIIRHGMRRVHSGRIATNILECTQNRQVYKQKRVLLADQSLMPLPNATDNQKLHMDLFRAFFTILVLTCFVSS